MNGIYDYAPANQPSAPEADGVADWAEPDGEPFIYGVAGRLHRLLHLPRTEHLAIWRRVLDLYATSSRPLPKPLQDLCQESTVDSLLENEVFWGMVGPTVSREFYARASDHLAAVYATAALLVADRDRLPLSSADRSLLRDPAGPTAE